MGGVAVQYWTVAVLDLARVVHDDDLGHEVGSFLGGVVLGVGSYEAPLELLYRHVLDVEAHVVTRLGLGERFVMHLHRFNFRGQSGRGEGHHHTGLEGTCFHSPYWHSSNTPDLVNVLQGQTKGLIGGPLRGIHRI